MEISNTDLLLTVLGSGISHSFIFARPQSCCVTQQGPCKVTQVRYISQGKSLHPNTAAPSSPMALPKISPSSCPQTGNPHSPRQAALSIREEKGICAGGWGGRGGGRSGHPSIIANKTLVKGAFGGDALLLLTWKPKIRPG